MNNKKSTGLLLSILGVVSLVLITAGVTYAFFSYTKMGSTKNTITTGRLTFVYDEVDKNGHGINIENAVPMTDEAGKALITADKAGEVFHFTVTSDVISNNDSSTIPYEVTVLKGSDSDQLDGSQVKIYLYSDKTDGTNYTVGDGGVVKTYDELTASTISGHTTKKVIYRDTVTKTTAGNPYINNFKLTMWMKNTGGAGEIDYSPLEFVELSSITEDREYTVAELAGKMITSKTYYTDSSINQDDYVRIAFANQTQKKIVASYYKNGDTTTATSKTLVGLNTDITNEADKWVIEQYYPNNNKSFSVTVNVYAGTQTTTE